MLHAWWPPVLVLVFLIAVGMTLALAVGVFRGGRASRGAFDPRNADWHPLALLRRERQSAPQEEAPAGPDAVRVPQDANAGDPLSSIPGPVPPVPEAGAAMPSAPEAPEAPDAPQWS